MEQPDVIQAVEQLAGELRAFDQSGARLDPVAAAHLRAVARRALREFQAAATRARNRLDAPLEFAPRPPGRARAASR